MGIQHLEFRKHRTVVVAPFVADADPRITPPADSALFELNDQASTQGQPDQRVQGHAITLVFKDAAGAEVVGPTGDFTTWVKDEGAGRFRSLDPVMGAESSQMFRTRAAGRIFVQLTAVAAVGAATTVEVRIAERSNT